MADVNATVKNDSQPIYFYYFIIKLQSVVLARKTSNDAKKIIF
jgi:hypothetical protein